MADIALKKLVQLINQDQDPDLRLAGIRVAGALGSKKDAPLVNSLLSLVDHSESPDRMAAIDALGSLGADEALEPLLAIVQNGGEEIEASVRAISRLGKKGTKAISKVMAEAPPHLRRRIAGALGHGATPQAIHGALQSLMDPETRVVEAAARSLSSEVPSLTEKQRHSLSEELITTVNEKKKELSEASLVAMLRILSEVQSPDAETVFWNCLKTSRSPAQRAIVLEGLGGIEWKMTDAKMKQLFECARERDFTIVSRALMILQKLPVNGKSHKLWEDLLAAPDLAAKQLAIQKLKEADTIELARALIPLLRHAHRGLQNDALKALQSTPKGRQALVESLLAAGNPDEAWSLARALSPHAKEISPSQRKEILQGACDHQDKVDPRAKAFWFLLRENDGNQTHADLEARAAELRKKKKYEQSLAYYQLLTREPTCGPEIRFEQAAVGLKLSAKDTAEVARNSDPCLEQFGRLHHNSSFNLLEAVSKAKWLDVEDLFYLGFHFAGENHKPAKELGRDILQVVIKKSPRSTIAKNAKSKLKTEGLSDK